MKNITVSVDEETHRLARIRAAELDFGVGPGAELPARARFGTEGHSRRSDNLPREELSGRRRRRAQTLLCGRYEFAAVWCTGPVGVS